MPLATYDRLSVALLIAMLVHAIVIFGVNFSAPDRTQQRTPLEITLSHTPSLQAPKHADYLAPDNQLGGGQGKVKAIPQAKPRAAVEAVASNPATTHVKPQAKIAPIPVRQESPHISPATKIDLAAVQQQISDYSAEFVQAQQQYARQSKTLYINSVSTHKYAAAAYEKAWQDKIERIGNLNYPEEARRHNLTGSLLLSVAISKDGSIQKIKVRQTSGHEVLDEAAKRIVELSAPFAPFPPGLSEEAEVLVITRTWKFFSDSHLSTAP